MSRAVGAPSRLAPALLPLVAFVSLDAALAACFAGGTIFFDERLAVLDRVSLNQILVGVGALASLMVLLLSRGEWLRWDYTRVVALTLACLSLSYLWTPSIEYGWEKLSHFAVFTLLAMAWAVRGMPDRDRAWGALLLLGGVGLVLGLGGIHSYATGGWSGRLSILGGGPIVFSRWVATAILVYGCWLLARGRVALAWGAPVLLPLTSALMFVLLLSNSKGSLLGFLLASAYMFLRLLRNMPLPRRIVLLVVALIAAGAIAYLIEPGIFMRLLLNPFDARSVGSYGARMTFLSAARQLVEEGSVLGVGIGGWAMAVLHEDTKLYPHNLLVELLVELGPVLGCLVIAAWVFMGWRWWRRLGNSGGSAAIAIKSLTIFWSVAVCFSGDLTDSRILLLVLAFLWRASLWSGDLDDGAGPPPSDAVPGSDDDSGEAVGRPGQALAAASAGAGVG